MINKNKVLDHLVKEIDNDFTDKYIKKTGKLKGRSGVMTKKGWDKILKKVIKNDL